MINREFLKILVCPDSRAPLVPAKDGGLVSMDPETRRLYRVEDEIPILLIDESTVLTEEEHEEAMAWARENHPALCPKK